MLFRSVVGVVTLTTLLGDGGLCYSVPAYVACAVIYSIIPLGYDLRSYVYASMETMIVVEPCVSSDITLEFIDLNW